MEIWKTLRSLPHSHISCYCFDRSAVYIIHSFITILFIGSKFTVTFLDIFTMSDLDALLNLINNEIDMDNTKLENRLKSVQKSRLLLDRFNEALTILKQKPDNGQMMYDLIYVTYIAPEKLNHLDITYRLGISSRHYDRLRTQAVNIISIRLWASPSAELDSWLEVLSLLEEL